MSAAAVDSATTQMANTSLNEPTAAAEGASTATGSEPINASQNEAVIASAAEGRRLYIGNLAYATTEGELKDFFKDYLVETTSIPTNPRTTRPVGYAFVDLSTPGEAERAVKELNGQTILDRKVSVQLARKPEPAAEGGDAAASTTRRRGSQRGRGGRVARAAATGGRTTAGRGRGRGRRDGATNGEAEGTDGPNNVPGQVNPLTDTTKEALTAENGEKGTLAVNAAKTGKSSAPRERKPRGPPEDGVPSKNKVMVANLPYDLKEERLMEIFADYQPSAAKLALRPIPRFMIKKLQARNEPRKGRGFGFVTLPSEELQQKACNEMNGKEIEGREIAVKVAIDSPGKEDDPEGLIEGGAETENGLPSTAEGSAAAPAAVAAT